MSETLEKEFFRDFTVFISELFLENILYFEEF